jgi:hypothetical protein
MTNDDKILERIRALLALSTSSNEFEAASAAAKAQELLLKHNLTLSQIPNGQREEITRTNFVRVGPLWLDMLMEAVATANCCKVIRNQSGNFYSRILDDGWGYAVFGTESNIEVAHYLFEYLSNTILRLTPAFYNRSQKDSFKKGAVSIIRKRLMETLQTFVQNPDARAMVHIADAAVSKRLTEDFPRIGFSKVRATDARAFNAGIEAGKSIPINRGVSNNPLGQKLIS